MSEDKKDFVIKDKRHAAAAPADGEAESAADAGKASAAPEDAPSAGGESADAQLPKIDFATFVFSLNSAVLVHLGIIDDPAGGKAAANLPMAKQTIDILGMLKEKTQGNLTSDEENMLKSVLYDLRMLYVKEKG